MAAITSTANNTISTVVKELALKEPLIIRISRNRQNIRLSTIKTKKDAILSGFDWLANLIICEGELTPKTIIFCNTLNDIARWPIT